MSGDSSSDNIAQGLESFEKNLGRLEEVVSLLERGGVTLEDSLGLFEEGMGLLKELQHVLEIAVLRIEELVDDGKGKLDSRSFDASS